MRRRTNWHGMVLVPALLVFVLTSMVIPCRAAELGHYAPALPAIRDFILPDPGLYYIQYNLYYTADTLKDKNGDSIDSIWLGPLGFDVDASSRGLEDTYIRPSGWPGPSAASIGVAPRASTSPPANTTLAFACGPHEFMANGAFHLPDAGAVGSRITRIIGNSIHKESMA